MYGILEGEDGVSLLGVCMTVDEASDLIRPPANSVQQPPHLSDRRLKFIYLRLPNVQICPHTSTARTMLHVPRQSERMLSPTCSPTLYI